MKIGDKVVFRKIADEERVGKIVGFNEDGSRVAIETPNKFFIVEPCFEAIVVIEEKK